MRKLERLSEIMIVLASVFLRLVPHPPNVTPIGALAVFGGRSFPSIWGALGVTLAALLLSDLVLGFYPYAPYVYGAFALSVLIGAASRRWKGATPVAIAGLASSVVFFVVTNLGFWWSGGFYPRTQVGLVECFVAALPFFRNAVLGDLAFLALIYGARFAAQRLIDAQSAVRRSVP